jgi:predicted HTH transcriptional regulator
MCRDHVDPAIVPIVDEIPTDNPERRILIFIVPADPYAHVYKTGVKDAYFVRIGRTTREAHNGILRELLVKKKALEPWDRRIDAKASLEDIDLVVFREALNDMGILEPNRSLEDYLAETFRLSEFVPPMTGTMGLNVPAKPRNFALLMFGREPTRFFLGAHSIFSIYPGKDRSEATAERKVISGPLALQARKLIELLNAQATTAFDKTSEVPNQQKYPLRALQEAVVNALVHRDYESDQPVRVTVFSDRIEFNSPGGLPRAILPEAFKAGKASPFWRNQSLAFFFNKLQLAQAEGQGIPTIIRMMEKEGCPAPVFELKPESVVCILPAHPRHESLRELTNIESKLILGEREEAMRRLETLLENDPLNYRALELFSEASSLAQAPQRVAAFIRRKELQPRQLNTGTVILLAQTILLDQSNPENKKLAEAWFHYASTARLEAGEVKRVALNYRKLGQDEAAIALIDKLFERVPGAGGNFSLLDLRARAKIDQAKKCLETAKNPLTPPGLKGRAWEKTRAFLASAEKDILKALETANNDVDRDYIQRDLDFLHTLQQIATKPVRRPLNPPPFEARRPGGDRRSRR